MENNSNLRCYRPTRGVQRTRIRIPIFPAPAWRQLTGSLFGSVEHLPLSRLTTREMGDTSDDEVVITSYTPPSKPRPAGAGASLKAPVTAASPKKTHVSNAAAPSSSSSASRGIIATKPPTAALSKPTGSAVSIGGGSTPPRAKLAAATLKGSAVSARVTGAPVPPQASAALSSVPRNPVAAPVAVPAAAPPRKAAPTAPPSLPPSGLGNPDAAAAVLAQDVWEEVTALPLNGSARWSIPSSPLTRSRLIRRRATAARDMIVERVADSAGLRIIDEGGARSIVIFIVVAWRAVGAAPGDASLSYSNWLPLWCFHPLWIGGMGGVQPIPGNHAAVMAWVIKMVAGTCATCKSLSAAAAAEGGLPPQRRVRVVLHQRVVALTTI